MRRSSGLRQETNRSTFGQIIRDWKVPFKNFSFFKMYDEFDIMSGPKLLQLFEHVF